MKAQRIEEGAVQRKVDCQACGKPKLEGEVCEAELAGGKACGWPQIEIQEAEGGILLFLPLCPSTNARQVPAFRGRGLRNTDEANDYIASVSAQLRPMLERAVAEWGWKPITYWRGVDIWTILPRTSADCHNYGKVLFDALEAAGFTFNDKYLLPNYRGVWHDTKEAALIIKA